MSLSTHALVDSITPEVLAPLNTRIKTPLIEMIFFGRLYGLFGLLHLPYHRSPSLSKLDRGYLGASINDSINLRDARVMVTHFRSKEFMGTVTNISRAKFSIGDLVHHQLFAYRGVIVDVDATFQATDAWYETVAKSRPPKDKPWYHVLVHGAAHATYVAEQNLERDASSEPIIHPMLAQFFSRFEDGRYFRENKTN
ncbi:MAG: heat shock protein HspQ [Halieaceae bacterium]|jgi:heat shock protein HspQ